jgi:hypothetical protein
MTNKEFHGQITSDMFYWLTIILSHGTFVYANKKKKDQHIQQGDALKDSDALLEASSKERTM